MALGWSERWGTRHSRARPSLRGNKPSHIFRPFSRNASKSLSNDSSCDSCNAMLRLCPCRGRHPNLLSSAVQDGEDATRGAPPHAADLHGFDPLRLATATNSQKVAMMESLMARMAHQITQLRRPERQGGDSGGSRWQIPGGPGPGANWRGA